MLSSNQFLTAPVPVSGKLQPGELRPDQTPSNPQTESDTLGASRGVATQPCITSLSPTVNPIISADTYTKLGMLEELVEAGSMSQETFFTTIANMGVRWDEEGENYVGMSVTPDPPIIDEEGDVVLLEDPSNIPAPQAPVGDNGPVDPSGDDPSGPGRFNPSGAGGDNPFRFWRQPFRFWEGRFSRGRISTRSKSSF